LKLLSQSVDLSPKQKGIVSTHMGFITTLLQPYSVEFLLDSKNGFTSEIVRNKFQVMLGTKSNVRTSDEAKHLGAKQGTVGNLSQPMVPKAALAGNAALQFQDEEAFKQALSNVRNDQSETTWLLATYAAKNTIGLLGSGTGSIEDLSSLLEEANVNFGLLRVTEVIDKSVTTKFVYIKWQPEAVPYMKKADIGTKKGAIDDLFRPFHVDFQVSEKKDLSTAIVMDKVAAASGKKSNVRASSEKPL